MSTHQTAPSSRASQAKRSNRRSTQRPASARRVAQRRRPRMSRLLAWLLSALLGSMGLAHAQVGVNTLPMGGRVVVGSGQVQQGSNTLVITQATPKLGMDWQSFNIGSAALVEFVQPGADSVALNRVLGNSGSEIYGRLRANGQVFLVNPNGILFAPGSKVDVGGLVASTLDLSQQDFADGRYNFRANTATGSSGSVVNQGELRANAGGYLALFGNRVDNQGTVQVDSGSVILASGRAATVSISGSGLISAVVTAGDVGSVSNSGSILADGGVVTMTAQSAEGVARSLVNNSGIIRANSLVEHNGEVWITGDDVTNSGQVSARSEGSAAGGRITLMADLQRGQAQVGGTLDASSAAGDGGFIETSGSRVKLASDAHITTAAPQGRTGTWLIDPTDFNIAASGGDLTGAQLSTQLASNNVTIASTAGAGGTLGDVNVADNVSWSANRLTLNAQNNIRISQALSGTGTATLRLEFGQGAVAAGNVSSYGITAPVALSAGASFTTKQGSNGTDVAYTVINTLADLQAIDSSTTTRSGNWALGADIDGSAAGILNNGTGYKPIGSETAYSANNTTSFTGRLDGLGHTVNNLAINRAAGNYTGIFASAAGATFRNLTLSGENVTGSQFVGGLVGYAGSGTSLSYVYGNSISVSAVDDSSSGTYAGGLVGSSTVAAGALVLANVSTSGSVSTNTSTGTSYTGGVVGQQGGGSMTAVTSAANVTATQRTGGAVGSFSSGGLAGRFDGTLVTQSSASGTVSGGANAGGLIGWVNSGNISNDSASGSVTGVGGGIGGLIGYYGSTTGSISNSSASGAVLGGVGGDVGGLVGVVVAGSGSLTNSSATGGVSGPSNANATGGLVGDFRMTGGISNVTAGSSGSTVSGGTYAGGVIGYANSSVAVNASVGGGGPFSFNGASVSGTTWAGGLVGYSAGTATFTNLTSSVPVSSAGSAGGLIGYSAGLISGGSSAAMVSGGTNGVVGGIVGQAAGGVAGSHATGAVSTAGTGAYIGGLAGTVTAGSVTDSTATGNITNTGTSGGRVGGLIGNFSGTGSISNASATGTVAGGTSTGGLVGYASTSGNVSGNSATGDVSTTLSGADVGGLFGFAQGAGAISNSFARGNVTAPSNASTTGGLVGQLQMAGGVLNSNAGSSGSTVTGGANTGGVVGYSTTTTAFVTDSNAGTAITFNGASVTGTTWVGGLVGYSNGAAAFTGLSSSAAVTGTGSAGGVVGYANGQISGVTSSATVNGGNAYVGGIAGQSLVGISNSAATGAVTASTAGSSIGGLVGYVSGGSVTNSSATGNVRNNATGNSNAGGLIGYMGGSGTSITNSQASGSVNGGTNAGGLVGYFTIGGTTGGNISGSSATGDVITTLTGGDVGGLAGYALSVGTLSNSYARGNVTAPATADTVGGLVGQFSMTGGLSNSSAGAAASGNTAATTVSGGNYTGGVIGWSNVNTAFVTDTSAGTAITFNGSAVSGNTWVGGLFGQSTGTAALTGLSSSATVTGTGSSSSAGGLAGYTAGNVSNSSASGAVAGTNYVGGLIGQAGGTGSILVSGSSATGTVSNTTATGNVGGLIGYDTGPGVSNSTATGPVSGGNYAGGLVGSFSNNNSIAGSRADGAVSGAPNAGGLAGYTAGTGTLSSSTATGSVTGTANTTGSVGGLVGEYRMSGGITGSRAQGAVSTGYYVGGLVGYSSTAGSITTSTVGGTSITGGQWVGGFIGYAAGSGTIDGITVGLNVTGATNAGGLAGYSAGLILNSSASGAVNSGASYAGGLVAYSDAGIRDSSATGSVSVTGASNTAGGLAGTVAGGSVTGSSASGAVMQTATTGGGTLGGLLGYFTGAGSVSNSSATGNVSGGYYVGGLIGNLSGSGAGGIVSGTTASGAVSTSQTGSVAGLLGRATGQGAISNSSATGSVTAASANYVGGLAGEFYLPGGITNSQAGSTGSTVSGGTYTGGVVGYYSSNTALVSNATTGASVAFRGASVSGTSYAGGIVGFISTTADLTGLSSAATVSATAYAGGIAGRAAGNVTNLSASGDVSGRSYVGGIIGMLNGSGTVAGSQATGAVSNTGNSGSGSAGGLIGSASMSSGTIGTSTASGAVSGGANAGGLLGDASSVTLTVGSAFNSTTAPVTSAGVSGGVVGSLSNGSLSGAAMQRPVTGVTAGGAVGLLSTASLTNSSSSAQVTGTTYVGGLVGRATGTSSIADSSSSAPVTANGGGNGITYAGGLLGYADSNITVTRTSSTGNVLALAGSANAGGLIGYISGYYYGSNSTPQVTDNVARGNVNVDASSGWAGGLIGYTSYTGVARSDAYGTVTALDATSSSSSNYGAGGLIGHFDGTTGVGITSSNAYGNVTGRYYAGGLVGTFSSDASITGSTAHGNVSGTTYVGGLAGYFSGSTHGGISSSSATGNVSGANSYSGGLVGYYTASNSLSNVSASGNVAASGGYAGGLVGYLDTAGVSTGFASGNVNGSATAAGGLVGYISYPSNVTGVTDSRATGSVSTDASSAIAGGLVGYDYNYYGTNPILNSTAEGNVAATGLGSTAGGLVGQYLRYQTTGNLDDIRGSFASGTVSASSYAGGLVGNFQGVMGIRLSGATGNVTLTGLNGSYAGGLVGRFYGYAATAQIDRSWSSGNVGLASGLAASNYTTNYMGGLVGQLYGSYATSVQLSDAYATGNVNAVSASAGTSTTLRVGGLVGEAQSSLRRSYATGAVNSGGFGTISAGGLVGRLASGTVTVASSFWATDTTGLATSDGGTGQTISQLRQLATYPTSGNDAWSISGSGGAGTTWRIYEGFTTPLLAELLTPATISLADTTKVYDGTSSFGNGVLTGSGGAITRPDLVYINSISPNVGTYAVAAANIYSTQRGYDLSVSGNAQLSITPRPLTLAGVVADKVYDGTRVAGLTGSGQPTGLVAGEDLHVDGSAVTAVFDTKDVGSNKSVTVSGYTLSNGVLGLAANYSIGANTQTTASITPKALTGLSFTATDRVYDGSTAVQVAVSGGTLQGVIAGDDVTPGVGSGASGAMADKNVGSSKAVTVSGGTLTGHDAGNYVVGGTGGVTVNITQKAITVNGLTADSRAYNANTNVTVRTGSAVLTGLVSGDIVQLADSSFTGQLADKNADTAKAVSTTGIRLRGPDALNYTAHGGGLTVDITPANISWYAYQVTGSNRLYDGTTSATVGTYLYSLGGDNVTLNIGQSVYVNALGTADKNVVYNSSGTPTSKNIAVSGATLTGSDAHNYTLYNTSYTTSGVISPIPLTVTGVTAADRVYDGTTSVAVNVANASVDLSRQVTGDDLGVQIPTGGTVAGTLADKNVGTNKAVTNIPGLTLTGNDRQNYTLTGTNGVTVNISQKNLTATYTGIDRAYDGTNFALVQASSSDIVAGDAVDFYSNVLRGYYYGCYYYCAQFTGTGAKNVGQNKAISVTSDTLTGNDAGNYRFVNATTGTATASVTPKAITAQFTGVNKIYDGSTSAQVNLNIGSSGIYSGDVVTATGTGVFVDKNVAFASGGAVTSKAVAVSGISISGTDAFNYSLLNTSSTTTASITPKAVTLTGITPQNRSYDGTTTVAISAGTVTSSGFVSGDDVSVQQPSGGLSTGTVTNKNIGSNKPVTVTGLTLGGADAGNYSIDLAGSGLTVNITGRAITAIYTGLNKVYDGGTAAQVTGTSTDLLQGDTVGFTQSAIFTGIGARNVGTGKAIGVSSIALTGADAANYTLLNTSATTSADITPKGITVTYTGLDRVYNGATDLSALVQGASNGLVAGDIVGFNQQAAFQTDGLAGNGKAVSVSAIALTGTNAANYSLLNSTATTTANITRKAIGVTGISAIDRSYDGTTQVQISVGNAQVDTSGVVGQDQVSVSLPPGGISTGTLRNGKNAGQAKAVDVSGLAISGADAANYQLVGATGLTVNIAALAVNATFAALDKIYDGSAQAQLSGSSSGFLSIDAGLVGLSVTGAFSDKNAGMGKTVNVTSAFLTGAERANYTLANNSGQTTASISRKAITPQYSGGTRVYDGTLNAVVSSAPTTGIVAGDQIGFSQTAVFSGADGKNVGTGKAVAVSSIFTLGADAGNYQLTSTTATTTASVTAKPITVSGLTNVTAQDRVYDGTRVVTVVIPSGSNIAANSADIVSGDDVSIAVPASGTTTGSMANKTVGSNKAVLVDGLGLSGADSGNYSITGTAGITVNISQKSVTASYTGVNKVYDGSISATATGTSADLVSGDTVSISGSGQFTGTGGRNAGTDKAVSVTSASLSGADAGNYTLLNHTGSTTASITPRNITPSFSGGTRVYDGSLVAPLTNSTGNFVSGDAVSLTATGTFADKDVAYNGSGAVISKPVAITGITLSGADAGNYTLTSTSGATSATITPKPLVLLGLSGLTAVNRVYDGTRTVTVNIASTGGIAINSADIVGSDDVGVDTPTGSVTTGTVANKNVGTGKAVAVNGLSLNGADAGNYSIAATNGLSVNITPRDLTASFAAASKIYDGTTSASVTGSSTDILAGDSVSFAATGLFVGGKNVGTGKTVAVTAGRLAGTDAINYTLLNTTASTTADITPRDVSATYTGGTRIYDGGTSAPVIGTLANLIANDRVVLGQTAQFTDGKNVGDNKPVAISGLSLSGDDAVNYNLLTATASATASVTPRPLHLQGLTGVSASDRVYDGTTTVSVSVASTGTVTADPTDLVAGDTVTVNAPVAGMTTGTMLDKNVGTAKPVAVTGLSLSGADAANYTLQGTTGVSVNITPRPLSASYAAQDRVYDGSTSVTITAASADAIAGDILAINAQGTFTGVGAKNAGTGKTVGVTGGVLSGSDAANYALLNPTGSTTATIVARSLSISYLGGSRVYDATLNAPVTAALSGLVAGDDLQSTQTAAFSGADGKNVGVGKAVTISAITLTGADLGNYNLLTTSATTTGTITPRALTVSGLSGITAVDRAYDGTLAVSLSVPGTLGSPSGDALAGDQVAVAISSGGLGAGTLLDKNVGLAKSVVLSGLSLTGADSGNYYIAGTTGLTVNITPKALNALFTGVSRAYDGSTQADVLGGSSDVVIGDSVAIAGTGQFTGAGAKNVGIGKNIAVTGATLSGTDAANYALTGNTGTATADITPRSLTANYVGGTRVYDGTTAAPVTRTLTGLVAGDTVTVAESAEFAGSGAKNVGTNKAVAITGITLSGTDAGNYALLAGTASTTGGITPRPLTVSGLTGISAQDRVYDGTAVVTVNIPGSLGSASGDVIAGDDVTVAVAGGANGAHMLDKNVGSNKSVVLDAVTLSGADAANYTISGTLGLTVNITARALSIAGVSVTNRVYDGSTVVAIDTSAGTLTGAVSGDDVSLPTSGVTGSMADKNVGQNKAVSVSGLTLAGADLGNYNVSSGPGLTVNITPRTLTAAASLVTKVYDGDTGATVTIDAADRVLGDAVTLSGTALYASRNAGTGLAVTVSGITLSGADAANYQLAATQLATTGNIDRRSLTITPTSLDKVYGNTVALSGTAFTTGGQDLASGESVGSVTLSSAGTASTAAVQGSPYGISTSNASGGNFDAGNYNITYGSGLLTVRPRPVTVAANGRVLVAGDTLPALNSYGFSTSVDGLVGSDSLSAVTVAPQGLNGNTAVGGFYVLQPSNAVFNIGSASNYALAYAPGVLLVLPPQPLVGDTSGGGGGGSGFAVTITPQERDDALDALLAALRSTAGVGSLRNRTPTTAAPLVQAMQNLSADDLALLLSGDSRKLNVPALLKLPLFTFDPELRRLMQSPESTPTN